MTINNMCKFPPMPALYNGLTVPCFVKETDYITMVTPFTLRSHRMMLCVRGEGVFNINGSEIPFRSGSLIFGFVHETMFLAKGQDITYLYIDYFGARADELLRRFNVTKQDRAFNGFDGLIPLWQENLSRASAETIDLDAESTLLHSFSRLAGNTTKQNDVIGKICSITEESFANSSLSLATIAATLSYNPKYLSHIFKQKMGVSYSEYLCTVRIRYATSLFDHGLDSVKNVALLSGFSDPLYFSSVFKKNIGLSPREYIASVMNKIK